MKIGRNDPCHCGSGKKYKKCCAEKDLKEEVALQTAPAIADSLGSNLYQSINDKNNAYREEHDDEYPPISEEQTKLVDEWWEVYKKIESLDEIRNHLDNFLDAHPHLAENLGLEHEVLFELGAQYLREERQDEYIPFLMDFRNRFPIVYAKSAGYYDGDIIAWLISKGKADQVDAYLRYFIEQPLKFKEQLLELMDLLLATGTTEEIIPLVKQAITPIIESEDILLAQEIVDPLAIHTISPYIKPDFNREDIIRLIDDLYKVIPFKISEEDEDIDIWIKKLSVITKPFGRWPDAVSRTPQYLEEFYFDVTLNFMRYLYEKQNMSWMSAQYFTDLMYRYLIEYAQTGKKMPEQMFDFSRKKIETILIALTKQMFIYVNCTKFFGLLNALYFFADYLNECSNLTKDETETAQNNCISIYQEYYSMLKNNYYEALCFGEFPLKLYDITKGRVQRIK